MLKRSPARAVSFFLSVSVLMSSAIESGQTSVAEGTNVKSYPQATSLPFAISKPAAPKIPIVSDRSGNLYIYMMAQNGSQTKLTNKGTFDNGPSLSPDGKRITFYSSRDGNKQIYVMGTDGNNAARLTNNKFDHAWPAWSPDGSTIAFSTSLDGNNEIYSITSTGTRQTRLTGDPANDILPAFSPDGSKIAFVSDRKGRDDIYVMSAKGENVSLIRLTTVGTSNTFPAWSPDGSKIAFQTNRDGHDEIYIMNADGTKEKRLTNTFFGSSSQPVWVDNGSKIAFTSDRGALPEIYVMNADGTNQTRITNVFAGSWTRGKPDVSQEATVSVASIAPSPNETVVTTFQPGHNFTYITGGGNSTNDPTFFCSGNQSLKITTAGNFTQSIVQRTGISPTINMAGQIVKLVVAVDNTENLTSDGQFLVAFSSNNFDGSNYVLYSATAEAWQAKPGRDWVTASWSLTDAVILGSVNLSAINSIRIYVRDAGTGILHAWIQSISLYPPKLDHGIVSITFDDAYASQYTYGLSKMNTYGYPATAFIIPNSINVTGYLSLAQLREMQDTYRWDISAHDYLVFQGMTAAQTEAELLRVQNYLWTNNLTGGQHFAYPGGYYNTNIMLPQVQKYFITGREAATDEHEVFPPANYRSLKVISLTDPSNDPAAIATQVAYAKQNKDWLILVFHNLVVSDPHYNTDYLVGNFNSIIDNINQQGIAVKTISQVLAELDDLPSVTNNPTSNVGVTAATLNATLTSLGAASNVTVSFDYGTSTNYTMHTIPVVRTSPGVFSANITGLNWNTTYHFRATANGTGTFYSFDQQFTTLPFATVTGINVVTGGTGYTSPAVSITGGGATTNALATALGAVSAISANLTGTVYTSVPNVTITGGGGSGAAANLTISILSNLVGQWHFDEGTGTTTVDASLNGHTGNLTNSPTWTTGKSGGAIRFNGVNQYVDIAAPSNFAFGNGNFTISAWFKRAFTNRTDEILSIWSPSLNRANLELYFGDPASNNQLKTRLTANNGSWQVWSSGVAVTDTNWHQVTVVNSNNNTLQFYIDGNLTAAINHSGLALDPAAQYVRIGGRGPQDYSGSFNGTIDEVTVWNQALSLSEIKAFYLGFGLVGQWHFDEGTGTTTVDTSLNGHTGNLTNSPAWTTGKFGGALRFNGVNQYVDVAAPANFAFGNGNFTISAWFKRAFTNRTDEILSIWSPSLNRANLELYFGDPASNNQLKTRLTANNGSWQVWSSGVAVTDTNWHQVTVVNSSNNTLQFYIDGNLTAAINHSGLALDPAAQYVRIGGRGPQDYSGSFNGTIDEVAVWNRALNAPEINDNYWTVPNVTDPAISVTGITLTAAGNGYTSAPTVNIIGSSLAPGLAAQWHFDEGAGNTTGDGSPNGHTGTLVNSPAWTTGKFGGALRFNGVNQYVDVAAPANFAFGNGNFTISAWFKRAFTNRTDEILSIWSPSLNRANLELYFGDPASNNQLKTRLTANNGSWQVWSSGVAVTDTNWHQVTVVNSNNNTLQFYIDGNLTATINHSGLALDPAAQYVRIGGRGPQDYSGSFNGTIDEVAVWNRALSNSEVYNNYITVPAVSRATLTMNAITLNNAGAGYTSAPNVTITDAAGTGTGATAMAAISYIASGLVAHWHFDEGAGTTTVDTSLNGHTGNLTNSPTWTTGKSGGALRFNGVNQHVDVTAPSSFAFGNGNFTISAWFKRASTNRIDEILSFWSPSLNRANIEVYFGDPASNNQLKVRTTTNNGSWRVWSSGTSITDTNWHQVTIVNSNSTMQFYIDGNLTATVNHAGQSLDAAAQVVRIGGRGPQDTTDYFSGTIDELAVWNRALNNSEVYNNYITVQAAA